jgi:hypothetical protein
MSCHGYRVAMILEVKRQSSRAVVVDGFAKVCLRI